MLVNQAFQRIPNGCGLLRCGAIRGISQMPKVQNELCLHKRVFDPKNHKGATMSANLFLNFHSHKYDRNKGPFRRKPMICCLIFSLLLACMPACSRESSAKSSVFELTGEPIRFDEDNSPDSQTADAAFLQDSSPSASGDSDSDRSALNTPSPSGDAVVETGDTAGAQDTSSASSGEDSGSKDDSGSLTLLMVGDILLHTPVEKSALREDGSYSYDAIFENTRERISAADLALVNQEVILGGAELGISGYPAFNAPYEVGDDLVEAGFDVICHATNHALDKGKKGLCNCLNFWETKHPEIAVLGLHSSPDDPLYIYEKDGIRIAILNYTYGTNGVALPSDMPYAVDLLNDASSIAEDIRYAESVADFTIVCPHWGTEYRLTPDASQQKWTKLFLENGVDLVIGTHPHVIEPVEYVTDEATGHSMLVYYSLGNFVNWTSSSGEGIANRMVGGMAQVTLQRSPEGNVSIKDHRITALVCHLTEGKDGVSVRFLSDYNEDLAKENLICSQDSAFSYSYCVDLCNSVWGSSWD